MPVDPGPRHPTRAAPDPHSSQARFGLLSAVGVPVATADVLPVDKRCARGHQGLAEIAAAAEQFRHRAAVADGGETMEGVSSLLSQSRSRWSGFEARLLQQFALAVVLHQRKRGGTFETQHEQLIEIIIGNRGHG